LWAARSHSRQPAPIIPSVKSVSYREKHGLQFTNGVKKAGRSKGLHTFECAKAFPFSSVAAFSKNVSAQSCERPDHIARPSWDAESDNFFSSTDSFISRKIPRVYRRIKPHKSIPSRIFEK
jgi:hypothetical protein